MHKQDYSLYISYLRFVKFQDTFADGEPGTYQRVKSFKASGVPLSATPLRSACHRRARCEKPDWPARKFNPPLSYHQQPHLLH